MIVAQSPYRVSIIGGGTDFVNYFNSYGGIVLSFTIKKYSHITLCETSPCADYLSKIQYSRTEIVNHNNRIEHRPTFGVFKYFNIETGYETSHFGDLPSQTGLGTSSAYIAAMSLAFRILDKKKLTDDVIHIERKLLEEEGGYQDQVATVYGGFNQINFSSSGISVKPVNSSEDFLNFFIDRCVLVYTGKSRMSFELSKQYVKSPDQIKEIHECALVCSEGFRENDFNKVCNMVDVAWSRKRTINNISNKEINSIYSRGKNNGALCGKLLGAGGSGFLLFVLKEETNKVEFIKNMGLYGFPCEVDYEGTKRISL